MFGASDDQIQSIRELSIHELNARIPRKVRLDPGNAGQIVAFILIPLLVGAAWFGAFSYYAVQRSRHREALSREGRDAIGKVTELSNGRTCYAHYTFRVNEEDYWGRAALDDQIGPTWPDGRIRYARVGEQIPVVFLPSDPSINHPRTFAWWSWWDFPPHLFMLMFPSMGIVALVFTYRERRLARIGWVTEGKVIACAPKGKQFRVDYEFYTEDHEEFDGANEHSEEYKSGSSIRVIYLRKNPKRNDTYPMSSYETVE
jgi:hypothetical protein